MIPAVDACDAAQLTPVLVPAATVLAAILGSSVAAQSSRGKEERQEIRRLTGEVISTCAEFREEVGRYAMAEHRLGQVPRVPRWQTARARERAKVEEFWQAKVDARESCRRRAASLVAQLEVVSPRVAAHAESLMQWSSFWPVPGKEPSVGTHQESWREAEKRLVAASRAATSRWWQRRRERVPEPVEGP